jgi:hypothetical protein
MSFYSLFSDLLFILIFLIGFFYSSLAFTSTFAIIFIILKITKSLASWSDIAILFYVLKELDFPRFKNRDIFDLRFLFKIFISHEFRK